MEAKRMNMREALCPGECDKMNHFLGWLLSIDGNKEHGHKLDISKAMLEYRRTYGQPRPSEKLLAELRSRTWRSAERDKHVATLEKYRCFPIPFVAKMIGVNEKKVASWYRALNIERPFSYKGKSFDGVAQ